MTQSIIIPLILFAMFLGAQLDEDATTSGEVVTAYYHHPCEDCKEWEQ